MTNIELAEASAPVVYGLTLSTPAEAVNRLAVALALWVLKTPIHPGQVGFDHLAVILF